MLNLNTLLVTPLYYIIGKKIISYGHISNYVLFLLIAFKYFFPVFHRGWSAILYQIRITSFIRKVAIFATRKEAHQINNLIHILHLFGTITTSIKSVASFRQEERCLSEMKSDEKKGSRNTWQSWLSHTGALYYSACRGGVRKGWVVVVVMIELVVVVVVVVSLVATQRGDDDEKRGMEACMEGSKKREWLASWDTLRAPSRLRRHFSDATTEERFCCTFLFWLSTFLWCGRRRDGWGGLKWTGGPWGVVAVVILKAAAFFSLLLHFIKFWDHQCCSVD